MARSRSGAGLLALGLLVGACGEESAPAPVPAAAAPAAGAPRPVDDARLRGAEAEPESWLTTGRTYSEQRYSPLHEIGADNVGGLGLAWSHDLATPLGVEATPIVADGVMYVSGPWSAVSALDARTGARLWHWDPGLSARHRARAICCGAV